MTKDDLTDGDVGTTSVTSLLSLADVRDGHEMGRVTSTRLPLLPRECRDMAESFTVLEMCKCISVNSSQISTKRMIGRPTATRVVDACQGSRLRTAPHPTAPDPRALACVQKRYGPPRARTALADGRLPPWLHLALPPPPRIHLCTRPRGSRRSATRTHPTHPIPGRESALTQHQGEAN